jgi:hypothetical protein
MSEDPKPPTSDEQENSDRYQETLPVDKLVNEILAAVRAGGGNPDHNPRLRSIIQKCRDSAISSDDIDEIPMKLRELLAGVMIGGSQQPDITAANIAWWLYGPH